MWRGYFFLFVLVENLVKLLMKLGCIQYFGENQKVNVFKLVIIYGRLVGKNVVFVDFYFYSQNCIFGRKNWG